MLTLLTMSRTWGKAPSEILGVTESYCAWCLDETALYMQRRIFDEGEMPDTWTEKYFDLESTVEEMKQCGGVIFR